MWAIPYTARWLIQWQPLAQMEEADGQILILLVSWSGP